MADYCTTTDVIRFNSKRDYDTTSRPTATQVTSMIADITADMNGRFAAVGVSVPITTSPTHNAYKFVRFICALGSAGLAEQSMFMGGNKQSSEHSQSLMAMYEDRMKAIEKNPQMLNAIVSGGDGAIFDSYEYSNTDKRREEDVDEPFWRDELEKWNW